MKGLTKVWYLLFVFIAVIAPTSDDVILVLEGWPDNT
jgi:hypothetical protein